MGRAHLAWLMVVSLGIAAVAEAQAVQRPSRPYRGLFGGSSSSTGQAEGGFLLTASALSGYDSYLTTGTGAPQDPRNATVAGYSTYGEANLRYSHARGHRSILVEGGAFSRLYHEGNVDPTFGANVDFSATNDIGRRNILAISQAISYEPTLVLGGFAPLAEDPAIAVQPDVGNSGIVQQRSVTTNTNANVEHRWTTRQSSNIGVGYMKRVYLDESGYDTDSWRFRAAQSWLVGRAVRLHGLYSLTDAQLEDPGGQVLPHSTHSVEGGFTYMKRLSPSRRLEVAAGGGAGHVRSEPRTAPALAYWTPRISASMRLDVGRSWALSGDYRRSVSVLSGVSLESFPTGAATVRVDGLMSRRVELALSAAMSDGHSGGRGQTGSFRLYGGTAQMRYAVAACCAAALTYDYYYYNLHGIAIAGGLPSRYDRHAIRAGVTLLLPLSQRGAARQASSQPLRQ